MDISALLCSSTTELSPGLRSTLGEDWDLIGCGQSHIWTMGLIRIPDPLPDGRTGQA